jgi:hypothetical protein
MGRNFCSVKFRKPKARYVAITVALAISGLALALRSGFAQAPADPNSPVNCSPDSATWKSRPSPTQKSRSLARKCT